MVDEQNKNQKPAIAPEIERAIAAMGLDVLSVRQHQANVASFLVSQSPRYFPISDTCRLDNGGIQKLPASCAAAPANIPMVAFVPAAGASSRYLTPLVPLMESLKSGDRSQVQRAITDLDTSGLLRCPLPASIRELVSFLSEDSGVIPVNLVNRVLNEIEAPKALYPAVLDGDTFFEIKREEHRRLGDLAGEVFVCPPGRVNDFINLAKSRPSPWPVNCFEQGAELATVRFNQDAAVELNDHGQPSSVPAGHGSLLKLLPQTAERFPGSRGVFIRNIDNVTGTSAAVTDITQRFLTVFKSTLSQMDKIRHSLRGHDLVAANAAAQGVINLWGVTDMANDAPVTVLLNRLFHSNSADSRDKLLELMDRPFVLMGQVPNTTHDVGGTCVFTEVNGVKQKLCLEVPHASPSDKKAFLEDFRKSTHFNPVFVASEIPSREALSCWDHHPFWLIAKKSWHGRDVFYQESILYEMLGSSQYCNVIFVEIPRILFNPHKTLKDAAGRDRSYWIKD